MSALASILESLDRLESDERRAREREVRQARLTPLVAKAFLHAQAGNLAAAEKWKKVAERVMAEPER